MKILHVLSGMDPKHGGVCQAVRTMVGGLNSLGTSNSIVCLDAADAPFLKTEPLDVTALGPGRSSWCYSDLLAPWLLDRLPGFDVVIIHGLWQYHSFAVTRALRKLKAKGATTPKVFVMPHGMLDPYFQRASSRKIKAIRNWFYWKLIESASINEARGLLFTCAEERNLAREPFSPYKPKYELVVGLGVDEPPSSEKFFTAGSSTTNSRSPYLLFLSRIHEKKGVDLLVEAFQKLSVGKNIGTLVIAGPGAESDFGKRVVELVSREPETAKSISFPGMLAGADKWKAFYGCDAFVLPSHQENFGIAVVEALACGKPVLISNQVNIWREIEEANAGLVAGDTLAGTEDLIRKWSALPASEKQAMGVRARALYTNSFSIDQAAKRLLNALTSTV